jgi:A118 family predicted phage portal protein
MAKLTELVKSKTGNPRYFDFYKDYVEKWLEYYEDEIDKFHTYTVMTVNGMKSVKRKSMGMAKTVCEEWADMLFDETVTITVENTKIQELLKKIMDNDFYSGFSEHIEKSFASGMGYLVEYIDGEDVSVKMIDAGFAFPIMWTGKKITAIVEHNAWVVGDYTFTWLVWHLPQNGNYVVINELYKGAKAGVATGELGEQIDLNSFDQTAGLEPIAVHEGMEPAFQVIRPNSANNTEYMEPFGMSVFSNALKTIKNLDERYDEYDKEFKLGKRRVIVGNEALRWDINEKGEGTTRFFDANDQIFQGMMMTEELIKVIDFQLRSQPYIESINFDLNVLAMKTGFSSGQFTFTESGLKTATEVISSKSKTFRRKAKHEILLKDALVKMVRAIVDLYNQLGNSLPTDYEVKIHFNDSIIIDDDKERTEDRKDVAEGNMPKIEYLKRRFKLNDTEAQKWLDKIIEENRKMNSITFLETE